MANLARNTSKKHRTRVDTIHRACCSIDRCTEQQETVANPNDYVDDQHCSPHGLLFCAYCRQDWDTREEERREKGEKMKKAPTRPIETVGKRVEELPQVTVMEEKAKDGL